MNAQKKPTTRYELVEYLGKALGLPAGFSYAPTAPFSQVDKMVEIHIESHKISQVEPAVGSNQQMKVRIPAEGSLNPPRMVETVMNDPRRIPYGFLGLCPHPGYDPERVEKGKPRISSIYGSEASSSRNGAVAVRNGASVSSMSSHPCPNGTTYKKYPVLWPSKDR